jgi:4-aminobutyrate aminotransferase-like enzyme
MVYDNGVRVSSILQVNNVALVGHCHHLVVSAATEQYKLLNTNSRFIYPSLGLFTSRITQLMDQAAPLCVDGRAESAGGGKKWVVFLVNSGSEATDLALRIARSVANHRRKGARYLARDDV